MTQPQSEAALDNAPYSFRPYCSDDVNFILNSWGTSYQKGNEASKLITADEFHTFHRPIRESFFSRPSTTAIICCARDDEHLILGWIAVERPKISPVLIIHYVYTKQAMKDEGIGNKLLESVGAFKSPILYTHQTEKAERILNRNPEKYKDFHFSPHLL